MVLLSTRGQEVSGGSLLVSLRIGISVSFLIELAVYKQGIFVLNCT